MPETERPNIVGDGFLLLYDGDLPVVGADTVAQITGIGVGTINVWINRGVLPGVKVGMQGRARRFDASLVVHLAVMSALVRLGYPALAASLMAVQAFQQGPHPREPGVLMVITGQLPNDQKGRLPSPQVHVVQRSQQTDLEAMIGMSGPGASESFTVVDLSAIWWRVKNGIESASSD